jgi:hypothetical protein
MMPKVHTPHVSTSTSQVPTVPLPTVPDYFGDSIIEKISALFKLTTVKAKDNCQKVF